MSKKEYRVLAPNGDKVKLEFSGKIFTFFHGEVTKIEENFAKAFSTIFYEIKTHTDGKYDAPDNLDAPIDTTDKQIKSEKSKPKTIKKSNIKKEETNNTSEKTG